MLIVIFWMFLGGVLLIALYVLACYTKGRMIAKRLGVSTDGRVLLNLYQRELMLVEGRVPDDVEMKIILRAVWIMPEHEITALVKLSAYEDPAANSHKMPVHDALKEYLNKIGDLLVESGDATRAP